MNAASDYSSEALNEVSAPGATPDGVLDRGVICFAGEDWWYHTRGHFDMQVMRRLARCVPVLFVNSIVMQRPRWSEGKKLFRKIARKLQSIRRGLQHVENRFYAFSPISVPLHHREFGRVANCLGVLAQVRWAAWRLKMTSPLVWVECPAACDIALRLSRSALVYQRTDRHEEFRSEEGGYIDVQISQYDDRLRRESDLVVYASGALFEDEKQSVRRAFLSDHGVDFARFAKAARDRVVPEDIKHVREPMVGFFGAIDDHTFDVPFATRVVQLLPQLSFVFVGHASTDVSSLARQPNVTLVGQRPYELIPSYGAAFRVAIMTWRRNRWIHYCNPVKLKEYLALGLPVVSTPFHHLGRYDECVAVAETPEAFAKAISESLEHDGAGAIAKRQDRVRGCTWESVTARLVEEIRSIPGRR